MNIYRHPFSFKKVIKDTDNFHKYYNKLISGNRLPILIKSSSRNSIFSSKEETEDNKINKNISNGIITPKVNFNFNTIYNKILSDKKILKPITKRNLIYRQILSKSNSCLFFGTEKKIKLIPKLKSFSLSPTVEDSRTINFFNDNEKEFFHDIDYSNLNYNEYEIYQDKTVYDNIIKEKIKYFKVNKNENRIIKLEKNFRYGKNKRNINLIFDSLKITFKDMSLPKDFQDKNINLEFPFALLPIFYYKGFEGFIKFLSIVIKIENNFEKIYFDENKISEALNDLKDFQRTKEEDDKSDSEFELTQIKKEKPIDLKAPILERKKKYLKFNYFKFFWASNTRTFIVTITLPCIHLNIKENKICINHFLDYELLFYLYKRNFLNWEYYIIKNLSSYSRFRNIFIQIDSFSKIYNKSLFLKEPKTRINTFAEDILINIYTDQFNTNKIMIFKSFYLIATFINLSLMQEKKYHIYFNFEQYVKLYEISKYSSKIFFLANFLEINNELNTINFNFSAFDAFDIKKWLANIEKFSGEKIEENNNSDEELSREFDFFSNKIKIEFKKPKWSIIRIENKKESKRNWQIGEELEKDLIDSIIYSNSDSWINLLNQLLKKLVEPVPVYPEIIIKKKNKKKGTQNHSNNSPRNGKRVKSRIASFIPNI